MSDETKPDAWEESIRLTTVEERIRDAMESIFENSNAVAYLAVMLTPSPAGARPTLNATVSFCFSEDGEAFRMIHAASAAMIREFDLGETRVIVRRDAELADGEPCEGPRDEDDGGGGDAGDVRLPRPERG